MRPQLNADTLSRSGRLRAMARTYERIGLIGDIHAEDERLERALDILEARGVEMVVATGDIVDGFGSADRCCRILESRNVITVRGNHDRWLLAGTARDLPEATPVANITDSSREWLDHLPRWLEFNTPQGLALLCHGLGPNDMAKVNPDDYGCALQVNDEMIRREQVMSLLLEACPSYRARWEGYRSASEFDSELLFVHLGDFADHVVDLLQKGEVAELPTLSRKLEKLHAEGDDTVKEAATIGLLEGIQNVAGNRGVPTADLEAALGLETRRWWSSLDAFWSGRIPHVGADIVKGSR
jgi:predicted phosphodiesterase